MPYARTLSLCAAFAITGAGLMVFAAPSHARDRPIVVEGQPSNVIAKRVSFADLNLASVQGEKTLYRRVNNAVGWVCRQAVPTPILYERQGCSSASWEAAAPQLDRAVQRAREMAANGSSSIAATSITISFQRK